ncbi:NfeD family protein [uncultured Clostridium sp.]|uniref:NfeD family protein n=1 Tax=uncultured Clostridium sp. TaxID=59620 RepID=UPI0025E06FD6|nr:NfeD family protein [uncultured Clostridium sp.]
MEYMILWILIAVGAFVIDILSSSFCFVLLAVGSVAAIMCEVMGMNITIQVIVFAIVNIISISVGYPYLKKKMKKGFVRTPLMEEKYIGEIFEAKKEINDKAMIKVGGEYWTAINKGKKIKTGDKFKIIGIEGIKLLIEKLKEE